MSAPRSKSILGRSRKEEDKAMPVTMLPVTVYEYLYLHVKLPVSPR